MWRKQYFFYSITLNYVTGTNLGTEQRGKHLNPMEITEPISWFQLTADRPIHQ